MSVKRTPDPLGLLPDHIDVEFDGADPVAEMKALEELFNRENIMARIDRLRRHTQLAPIADELQELAVTKYGNAIPLNGDWELRARVAEAELAAVYFAAEALPARSRQETSKKALNVRQADNRRARDDAKSLYDTWLEYRGLYRNKTEFDKEVGEKVGVAQNTVRGWREAWQKDAK
ncbi:hypothetical protein [Dyella sp. 2HG41-7]|uniref:hypothetical protein n=1 Tax=Dyella sp. 2HG41-7 TaxID=2883239 RepID=UPI001F27FE12|nr:hypothetical protein [Dyella sp. 2HG41-7]